MSCKLWGWMLRTRPSSIMNRRFFHFHVEVKLSASSYQYDYRGTPPTDFLTPTTLNTMNKKFRLIIVPTKAEKLGRTRTFSDTDVHNSHSLNVGRLQMKFLRPIWASSPSIWDRCSLLRKPSRSYKMDKSAYPYLTSKTTKPEITCLFYVVVPT